MLEMLWKFVQLFTLTRFNAVYNIKNYLKRLSCNEFQKKWKGGNWKRANHSLHQKMMLMWGGRGGGGGGVGYNCNFPWNRSKEVFFGKINSGVGGLEQSRQWSPAKGSFSFPPPPHASFNLLV